jgi:transcriptional regulator with XRE-family HTH domain
VDEAQRRGRLIARLREERLWTREALGRKAGVSTSTITNVEEGRSQIRFGTLRKLADALEVEPLTLLHPEEEPTNPLSEAQPSSANFPDVLGMGEEELEDLRARTRRKDPDGNRLYAALTRAQEAAFDDRRRLAEAVEAGHAPYEELTEAYERDRTLFKLWWVVFHERDRPYMDADARRKPEAPSYPDTTDLPLDDAAERIRAIEQKIRSSARAPA